jgi:uncharacterized protein
MNTESPIDLDCEAIHAQLDVDGYAHLPGLFGGPGVSELERLFGDSLRWSPMQAEGMGQGEMAYLAEEGLSHLDAARRALFHCLAPLASRWDAELGLANGYPGSFQKFDEAYNREGGRSVYAHRLGAGGYLALQQRVADSCSFPFQVVALVSQPGVDFDGGEFVLTERRPRMQSRPAVIPLQAGDAAIICTSYRSTKGTHGFYRTDFKHAVSKVHSGVRLGLHLSFHDIDRPVN